jgi:uroporphyrinogen-III synthase
MSASQKILVLRSGAPDAENPSAPDVLALSTHEIVPRSEGIREALAFDARGARLIVSSRVTVRVFLESEQAPSLFGHPFAGVLAVGESTGDLLGKVKTGEGRGATPAGASNAGGARRTQSSDVGSSEVGSSERESSGGESSKGEAAAPPVVVPDIPGAAGILHFLSKIPLHGARILWPRGSDAADEPLEQLRTLGALVTAPVVYEKRPRILAPGDPALLAFLDGEVPAVAVGSLAALDVLLGAVRASGRPLPPVIWGVLGPETARAFGARGLAAPLVPKRPRLGDLIDLLRENLP